MILQKNKVNMKSKIKFVNIKKNMDQKSINDIIFLEI